MWINQLDIYVTPPGTGKTNGQSAWDAIGDPKKTEPEIGEVARV